MRVFMFVLMLLALAPASLVMAEDAMPSMSMPMPAAPEAAPQPGTEQVYICPMHSHIHGKKGDKCPICGMTLVPQGGEPKPMSMPPDSMDGKSDQQGAVQISPIYRQALGVKTAPAQMREFGKAIHAFGNIVPSMRKEYTVAVRTAGWIVDLKTDAVGDAVKKGDLMFTFYSPELMTAQSDYLIGSRAVGNSEQRLHLYGMDDKAIAELKAKGRFMEQTPFYAPADGTVTALNVRKGAYVKEGDTVLGLQDFSQVWVQAHLPVRDLQFLSVGTPATITIDETGETFNAVTDYIYPVADPQSRDGMARLVLDNPDGKLKTDTLVNVAFEAGSRERLAVPEEAVLYGGGGAYVIEDTGNGYFRPIMVKTGITAHGLTEISSGIKSGQNIVTSGQFMIDAESNLRGGMGSMTDMKGMGDEHKH